MASTSTNAKTSSVVPAPAPLAPTRLAAVPGVLGRIARERAADYVQAPIPDPASGVPAGRFRDALRQGRAQHGLALICEIKRSSPSQGAIADLDPVRAAAAYAAGGADALSVLTEPRHFGGQLEHLRQVVDAGAPPAMRKEFVVHPAQLSEAAQAGAAAALLIVAVLGEATHAYLRYAQALGLDVLVEVHDEEEAERATEAGATLLGVNNRDLVTLQVDTATAPRVIRSLRETGFGGLTVAESGYAHARDLAGVTGVADAALIGTSLAASGDLRGAVTRLRRDLHALASAGTEGRS